MNFAERFPKLTIGAVITVIAIMTVVLVVAALNAAGYTTIFG